MLVILTVFFYLHAGFSFSSLNSTDNVYSRFPTYPQSFNLIQSPWSNCFQSQSFTFDFTQILTLPFDTAYSFENLTTDTLAFG